MFKVLPLANRFANALDCFIREKALGNVLNFYPKDNFDGNYWRLQVPSVVELPSIGKSGMVYYPGLVVDLLPNQT